MNILISISGGLFLLILALNLAMTAFATGIKLGGYEADAELQKINNSPAKFQKHTVLALIEHACIILLAIVLFLAFRSYGLVLAIIWTACRIGEGSIFIYKTIKFRRILNVARQYSVAGVEKKELLRDQALGMFQVRDTRYAYALILWSIATLAYSTLFVIQGIVPPVIGWLGIVSASAVGLGETIKLIKPDVNPMLAIGGLPAMLFELLLGGWLLLSPLFQ